LNVAALNSGISTAFDQTTDNKGIHFFVAPGAASASSSAIALSAAALASTCDLAVPLLTAFVPLKTRQRKPLGGVLLISFLKANMATLQNDRVAGKAASIDSLFGEFAT
jgi:hypothetical protein